MVHKLFSSIDNLIPLAKTVLLGGLSIAATMLFSAFLMTVFSSQTCQGYLIYLSAREVSGLSLVVALESVACAFFIHTYIVKYEAK
ncbi:MAG: hypothetical protein N2Z65_05420 [Clostridiales bacterium]|nr:hypothetical protein [Clostridiales bacterium]